MPVRFSPLLYYPPLPRSLSTRQHASGNEALLATIGNDYADLPIQARNLFHTSIALYDAWAAYGDSMEGEQRG